MHLYFTIRPSGSLSGVILRHYCQATSRLRQFNPSVCNCPVAKHIVPQLVLEYTLGIIAQHLTLGAVHMFYYRGTVEIVLSSNSLRPKQAKPSSTH